MRYLIFLIISFFCCSLSFAQQDTAKANLSSKPLFSDSNNVQIKSATSNVIVDTLAKKSKPKHDPRKATFRSAVLPGWGQIYNRQYWKLPIVYGALAIPASLYFYNDHYYKMTKFAYQAVYDADPTYNATVDSTNYFLINDKVKSKLTGKPLSLSDYQRYRNIYKRNKDYSLLWFVILWGVNVADATVFGHLKDFDVTDDLTMHINPTYSPNTRTKGVSLVFSFKNPTPKTLPSF